MTPAVGHRSAGRNGWAQPAAPRAGDQGRAPWGLAAFALLALGDLAGVAAGSDLAHTLLKPLLMPALALYVVLSNGPRLLVAALLLGWGGDTLLLADADPAFLAGMASFAAGHVCYLALFRRQGTAHPRARGAGLVLVYGAALGVTVALLWPDLPPEMRVPVAGYSLLLTAMAGGATTLGPTAAAGGALFLLSDTLIATDVADWPQAPRPDFWIMLTYLAAQALLVRGVLTSGSAAARR
ncbi:lysoplasmalogenase [Streptomyces sp. AN091965]|uniref:lysoplasmalogenase n=1 Tax=Streptomyces sp. AN091965 TaxID=2927803 RepID=UPI001F600FDF|nr:lysoplasmalogenase [Streptomyces sp. AN091965]MCI3929760.1 lysoplasmalogenase [Streptomyces sp. AN091965]